MKSNFLKYGIYSMMFISLLSACGKYKNQEGKLVRPNGKTQNTQDKLNTCSTKSDNATQFATCELEAFLKKGSGATEKEKVYVDQINLFKKLGYKKESVTASHLLNQDCVNTGKNCVTKALLIQFFTQTNEVQTLGTIYTVEDRLKASLTKNFDLADWNQLWISSLNLNSNFNNQIQNNNDSYNSQKNILIASEIESKANQASTENTIITNENGSDENQIETRNNLSNENQTSKEEINITNEIDATQEALSQVRTKNNTTENSQIQSSASAFVVRQMFQKILQNEDVSLKGSEALVSLKNAYAEAGFTLTDGAPVITLIKAECDTECSELYLASTTMNAENTHQRALLAVFQVNKLNQMKLIKVFTDEETKALLE